MSQSKGVTQSRLTAFPRSVAWLVAELVCNHNVRVRVAAGQGHLFLYSGDSTRPFKVSASRDEELSLKYLNRWAIKRGFWEEKVK